jgi:N-methylhydantoinase A
VTDANLLLGYLSADAPLAGGVALDRDAAAAAVGELAAQLGLELRECAAGILRLASTQMAGALRVVTVERGVDPRGYALLAFGGAGPLHATQIADELGIDRILCARSSGVLAALGLVVSPRRRDAQRSVLLRGASLTAGRIAEEVHALGEQAREALGEPLARLQAVYELRYRGQSFELAVPGGLEPAVETLREDFQALHEERYGHRTAEGEVELVTIRVSAMAPAPELTLAGDGGAAEPVRATRRAVFGGAELEVGILRGTPGPGAKLEGPAIVELPESTLLVPPGWRGEVHDTGTIVLRRADVV